MCNAAKQALARSRGHGSREIISLRILAGKESRKEVARQVDFQTAFSVTIFCGVVLNK